MTNPLDNFYTLDQQHHQAAYNTLMKCPEIQDPLLWTAQPQAKGHPLLLALFGTSSMVLVAALILYFEQQLSLWWLVLSLVICIFITLLILIAAIIWFFRIRNHQQTHYGISKTTIWVKPYHQPLQIYPLDKLNELKNKNGKITFLNQKNKEQVILRNLATPHKILSLLLQLQQEQ